MRTRRQEKHLKLSAATGYFDKLPQEIVDLILDNLRGDDQLHLACTSRSLLTAVAPRLVEHRKLHEKFSFIHDRHPLTILSVLRLAIARPEIAWHIRKIEIWEARLVWEDWHPGEFWYGNEADYPFKRFQTIELKNLASGQVEWSAQWDILKAFLASWAGYTHLTDVIYQPAELEQYEEILQFQMLLNEEQSETAMEQLRKGDDEVLKAVLISICPRLRELIFVQTNRFREIGGPPHHPLNIVMSSIRATVARDTTINSEEIWSPGLKSLQTLVVSESIQARHPHDHYYLGWADAGALLLLPNLVTLRLSVAGIGPDNRNDWEFGDRTSNLQRVEFYVCEHVDDFLKHCTNPKSIKLDETRQDGSFEFYTRWKDTLEDFVWKHSDSRHARGFQTVIPQLTCLKRLAVTLSALQTGAGPGPPGWTLLNDRLKPLRDLRRILPQSLEILSITDLMSTRHGGLSAENARMLAQELGQFALSKRRKHRALKNICAVMFGDPSKGQRAETGERDSKEFRELERICHRLDIALHLSKQDLEECPGEEPENWEPRWIQEIPESEYPISREEYTPEYLAQLLSEDSPEEAGRKLGEKCNVSYDDYEWNGPNAQPLKKGAGKSLRDADDDEHRRKKRRL